MGLDAATNPFGRPGIHILSLHIGFLCSSCSFVLDRDILLGLALSWACPKWTLRRNQVKSRTMPTPHQSWPTPRPDHERQEASGHRDDCSSKSARKDMSSFASSCNETATKLKTSRVIRTCSILHTSQASHSFLIQNSFF